MDNINLPLQYLQPSIGPGFYLEECFLLPGLLKVGNIITGSDIVDQHTGNVLGNCSRGVLGRVKFKILLSTSNTYNGSSNIKNFNLNAIWLRMSNMLLQYLQPSIGPGLYLEECSIPSTILRIGNVKTGPDVIDHHTCCVVGDSSMHRGVLGKVKFKTLFPEHLASLMTALKSTLEFSLSNEFVLTTSDGNGIEYVELGFPGITFQDGLFLPDDFLECFSGNLDTLGKVKFKNVECKCI